MGTLTLLAACCSCAACEPQASSARWSCSHNALAFRSSISPPIASALSAFDNDSSSDALLITPQCA